ncbi:MAG: 50S ribosomal protein L35 [Planctomycetota bacterium]|jgi:large subunit ribosomal protein L35
MPKLKTRSSIAKRFKITKRGKVLPLGCANTSHIMSKKNAKRRRRLRNPVVVESAQAKTVKRQMGA